MRHLRFGSPFRATYAHNPPPARCLLTRRLTHTVKPHRNPIIVAFLVYRPQNQLGLDRLNGTSLVRAALQRFQRVRAINRHSNFSRRRRKCRHLDSSLRRECGVSD